MKPWAGRVVIRDGDYWDEDLSNRSDLYSMALVKREETALTPGWQDRVEQARERHWAPRAAEPTKFEELARQHVGSLTGHECFKRFVHNMDDAGSKYNLTHQQKNHGSMMWSEKLKEKKAAQATEDSSKEISVICENQYADGDEW